MTNGRSPNRGPWTWIVATTPPKVGYLDEDEDTAPFIRDVLHAPGLVMAVNLREKLAEFRARHPDTSRTYHIDQFASAVGLSRPGVAHWIQRGCCLPDAAPRAGKGKRRRWSWRMAFIGFVLADK